MVIDFDAVMRDLNGEEMTNEGKPVVLKTICVNALLAQFVDETNLPGTEKMRRYKLAMKVNDGEKQDIPVDDVTEIRRLIAKGFPTLIVGRAYELLEEQKTVQ